MSDAEKQVQTVVDILGGRIPIVYFIRCNEYVKIGTSQVNFMDRLSTLQIGNPYKLTLEYFILGSYQEEKELHYLLKEHKVPGHGEWFKISKEEAIAATKKLYGRNSGTDK